MSPVAGVAPVCYRHAELNNIAGSEILAERTRQGGEVMRES